MWKLNGVLFLDPKYVHLSQETAGQPTPWYKRVSFLNSKWFISSCAQDYKFTFSLWLFLQDFSTRTAQQSQDGYIIICIRCSLGTEGKHKPQKEPPGKRVMGSRRKTPQVRENCLFLEDSGFRYLAHSTGLFMYFLSKDWLASRDFRFTRESGGAVVAELLHCSFPLEHVATLTGTHPAQGVPVQEANCFEADQLIWFDCRVSECEPRWMFLDFSTRPCVVWPLLLLSPHLLPFDHLFTLIQPQDLSAILHIGRVLVPSPSDSLFPLSGTLFPLIST